MRLLSYAVGRKLAWGVAMAVALAPFAGTRASAQSFEPGTFQGVIKSGSDNDESFGFIVLTLNRSGVFSMRFNLGVNSIGTHSYAFVGRFDASGAYHHQGPEVKDTRYAVARFIDLQLNAVDSPTAISGNLTDLTHSSTIEMERVAVSSPSNPAPQAGRYTFALLNPGDPSIPDGAGYGALSISRGGLAVMAGRGPDGRPFSETASITVNGRLPVFTKFAGITKGILAGWLNFQETADSDFSGRLTWLGPEVPGPNHAFVPQFAGDLNVVGSRYVVARGPVIGVNSSSNNVNLALSAGGLQMPLNRTLTLTPANRFLFVPRQPGDSLAVNPLTGMFGGTFLHTDNRVTIFRGAVLQKQNRGIGYFVDADGEAGTAQLNANP